MISVSVEEVTKMHIIEEFSKDLSQLIVKYNHILEDNHENQNPNEDGRIVR